MKTLDDYILQYKTNIKYLQDNSDETFVEILRTVGRNKFFCTPSRFNNSMWILEVLTSDEPSNSLTIVRKSCNFTDYHIDKKYVDCLRIKVDPFSYLEQDDLDGYIRDD